ncbi:hypothetical protein ACFFX0_26000 [Citricoccus parietis]|uniref:Uncharacterized protein n=1 Tax=Citricoccus parietis TaxID=592307 RepID=A0ABV5G687_9MICC
MTLIKYGQFLYGRPDGSPLQGPYFQREVWQPLRGRHAAKDAVSRYGGRSGPARRTYAIPTPWARRPGLSAGCRGRRGPRREGLPCGCRRRG